MYTIAWQGNTLITGSGEGAVKCWLTIPQQRGITCQLRWSSHVSLLAESCQLDNVRGLAKTNAALLKQRGADGKPAWAAELQEDFKIVVPEKVVKPRQETPKISHTPASFIASIGALTNNNQANPILLAKQREKDLPKTSVISFEEEKSTIESPKL